MTEETTYPLVALQFNISPGSAKTARQSAQVIKTAAQFLIREYIKRTRPDRVSSPTFVALHDGVTSRDCTNVVKAFRERAGCNAELTFVLSTEKAVGLIYDEKLVTRLTDTQYILAEDDFFIGDDDPHKTKSKQIFGRIAGGLFQHNKSSQFIVAISYHGIKNSTPELIRREYLGGIYPNLFILTIVELLSSLERKYDSLHPLYLIFGDFNFCLERGPAFLRNGWNCYPEKSERTTARCLHPSNPIDYVLLKAPSGTDNSPVVKEFSPLPLECSTIGNDKSYRFCNKANLITDEPFTANNDLRLIKYANKTLKGNRYF